jgi:hypothetical protein
VLHFVRQSRGLLRAQCGGTTCWLRGHRHLVQEERRRFPRRRVFLGRSQFSHNAMAAAGRRLRDEARQVENAAEIGRSITLV